MIWSKHKWQMYYLRPRRRKRGSPAKESDEQVVAHQTQRSSTVWSWSMIAICTGLVGASGRLVLCSCQAPSVAFDSLSILNFGRGPGTNASVNPWNVVHLIDTIALQNIGKQRPEIQLVALGQYFEKQSTAASLQSFRKPRNYHQFSSTLRTSFWKQSSLMEIFSNPRLELLLVYLSRYL